MYKSYINQLEDLCMSHDWTYEQSEDHFMWKRGNEQWKAIVEMQDKCLKDGYTLQEVYAVLRKYDYGRI